MFTFGSSAAAGAATVIAALGFLFISESTSPVWAQDNAFEVVPDEEAGKIDEIAKDTVFLQNRRARKHAGQGGLPLRGVHAKSHGCVKAEFVVEKSLAKEHSKGLFAEPGKRFDAWIRFSNASVLREDDLKVDQTGIRQNGSRGMAVKVLGVGGEILEQDNGEQNQDFLMINTPEFAFADVSSYFRLTKALAGSPKGDKPDDFFAPLFIPSALAKLGEPKTGEPAEVTNKRKQLQMIMASETFEADFKEAMATIDIIKGKIESPESTVRDPLQAQYFGAAPFLFGRDRVMKFSAAPCKPIKAKPFTEKPAGDPPENYLREALSKTMKGDQDQCFDFKIQVRDSKEVEQLKIEDATTTWPDELENYVTVAKIYIKAPQAPDSPKAIEHCERLAFSPWHALAAHRPLGGINRMRRSVYGNSAAHRGAGKN